MDVVKKSFWDTKKDRSISIIVLSVIGALLIFKLGMIVGYHKALFSYRSDDRYMSGMRFNGGMGMDTSVSSMHGVPGFGFGPEEFSTSHGATGRIVSVSLPSFVVASPDNSEKTVTISNDTMIRRFRTTVGPTDIQPDEFTVVLGNPDDTGVIQAKFIRLMPGMVTVDATASSSR